MQVPHCSRRLTLALTGGCVPLVLALTLPALPGVRAASEKPSASALSPQQVAETLDSISQPRFQQNAGRFGMSRDIEFDGHENVRWVDATNHFEKRRFAAINASHRSYVLAFLHLRHKPGAHIDPPLKPQPLEDFEPVVQTLMTVGGTQKGADNMFDWAGKALPPVVLPHVNQLKQGQPAQADYENWVIVMRPVRALHESCITCHVGTRRGDTLGVMVYAVDKSAKIKGQSFQAPGGE